jgi:hypothetical protein
MQDAGLMVCVVKIAGAGAFPERRYLSFPLMSVGKTAFDF